MPEVDEHLSVGGERIALSRARSWTASYLNDVRDDKNTWSYPAYEGYRQGHDDPNRLDDADLLAPALLNVNRITLRAYYALQSHRAFLEDAILAIPIELSLGDASDEDLDLLRPMFGVLDSVGIPDVRGTILAKILHRKRPRFVPLYDRNIRWCYQDSPGAPVPLEPSRTWADFVVQMASAMRADLAGQRSEWASLAALAPGPPITALRALDIVGWRAGSRAVEAARTENRRQRKA